MHRQEIILSAMYDFNAQAGDNPVSKRHKKIRIFFRYTLSVSIRRSFLFCIFSETFKKTNTL